MADHRYLESLRNGESKPRNGAASGARQGSGNDPLAELARLIGQNDPFAEFPRQPTPQSPPAYEAPLQSVDWHDSTGDTQDHSDTLGQFAATYVAQSGGQHVYAQTAASEQHDGQHAYAEDHHAGDAGGSASAYHDGYDPAAYDAAPEEAHGHEAGDYYLDAHGGDVDHQYRGSKARRSRILVVAILGFAVVGTSGAYGIRKMLDRGGSSPPPVIAADPSPTKIVPTKQASDAQSNKAIQDRVGDRGQNEKVVSREEQPVDMQDAARSFAAPAGFPKSGVPNSGPGATVVMPSNSSAPPMWAEQNAPRKVHTVAIPPAQPGSGQAAPGRTASAGSVTGSVDGPSPSRSSPKPAASAPPPAANAPLSLAPQPSAADPAPAPAKTRTASLTPPASRPGTSAGEGGYSVQISSQRSETDAQASFRSLKAKYASLLGDRSPVIRRADLGEKGIYYRALVGGFGSEEEAKQFCSSLKAAGGQCLIQRN